jgi:ABC-type uncharacterized transport system substrate-binding protein
VFDTFSAKSAYLTGLKMIRITRGEFITLIGGAAATWPRVARTQQPRRVGVLIASHSQTDREGQASIAAIAFLHAAEAVAPSLGVAVTAIDVFDDGGMERSVAAFAAKPDSGLVVLPHRYTVANRGSIIILAARHRLPAIYPFRVFAAEGGLISYGYDQIVSWRGAATYVDRILRGEKPGELPVQAPIKFELVVNLKTARALGLSIPPAFPLRADEVIE